MPNCSACIRPMEGRIDEAIAGTLTEVWSESPAKKAAAALLRQGITWTDVIAFGSTETGRRMNSMWITNTVNELRNRRLPDGRNSV